MVMSRLLILLALLLASATSHDVVDMRNGNYTESWTDVTLSGFGPELKVVRTYNSRTTFDGMFGFGWCSVFETRLDSRPDGTLKLTECGAGREVIYLPVNAAEPNHLYRAHGMEFDTIVKASGQYVRTLAGRNKEIFDSTGRRIRTEDANGSYLNQDYENGRLVKVSRNDGKKIVFDYDANGKVASMTASGKKTASYRHAGADLVAVTNAWGNSYAYAYDANHKLSRAVWPDQRFIALQYDAAHDWVTVFTDREGCQETYDYQDAPGDVRHYWTNLVKSCSGEKRNEGKYEFWHEQRADGLVYLARIRSETDGVSRDVRYHETFHLPVTLEHRGEEFRYSYYPNGQVQGRTSRFSNLSFTYAQDQVSVVEAVVSGEDGKEVSRTRSEFTYDQNGNMLTASDSDGMKLNLSYDKTGSITSLHDNRRHALRIQYDLRCAKPSVVTWRGVGKIRVIYNAACEIAKVDSKNSPAVAMQVASMFNNLLEVVAPATMEIYE